MNTSDIDTASTYSGINAPLGDGFRAEQPHRAEAVREADATPRLVIRGESPQTENIAAAALTDWLNVTFRIDEQADPEPFYCRFSEVTGGVFGGMTDRERGLHGWKHSFSFDRGQVMFALGGQRGTALLSIPGEGCAFISDWEKLKQFLRDDLNGKITRWDGAVDDFEGRHSVDLAVELYKQGGFNSGGRQPNPTQYGNWLTPDTLGRTFQVGRRKNGKLARIYEKGKQLGLPGVLAQYMRWVRWEVELHAIDREIEWEVLTRPGEYVAGAYPCMSWVSEVASRIRTIKAHDELTYARLQHAGSIAYGTLINVMLEREGSAERVVELLRRDGVPKRLAFTDERLRIADGQDGR
ncbi:MAG: Phage replication initiation protein [Betaproteobacteria bacterium]|nr:Phage replication initiation protein [Betaproteobacteria bacterium]